MKKNPNTHIRNCFFLRFSPHFKLFVFLPSFSSSCDCAQYSGTLPKIALFSDFIENTNSLTTKFLILPGSGVNDKESSTDPLVLVVACLGAFVLVFLILIIVCICKRNNGKPSPSANQSVETPEIHEKMLDHQVVQQSTGSPGSGSGRHHQHPNSHHKVSSNIK